MLSFDTGKLIEGIVFAVVIIWKLTASAKKMILWGSDSQLNFCGQFL